MKGGPTMPGSCGAYCSSETCVYQSNYQPYGARPRLVAFGDVKIDTKIKGGSIYIDGGYAGVIGKLNKFQLPTGTHDIEFRDPSGHAFYRQNVQVMPSRIIEIYPGH
jgi:hypothetical protein